MRCRAELVFETPDPAMIFEALAPEQEDELHRSGVEMVLGEGVLILRIRGEDVVSLRAALNTWIRLAKVAFEMVLI
jgi:KEOPS complex subunit Pcc1